MFTIIFTLLIVFDHAVLHRKQEALSFARACCYTLFWVLVAMAFNFYIYLTEGREAAFSWCTGYILEWMLSIDNLFVFHLVFRIYGTPDHLKHKPLFYGIIGAIIFRLIFFVLGESLFHSVWWMHIVFGLFLIYTGIKTAGGDDDDDDPSRNPIVIWLSKRMPLVNGYDVDGRFFVRAKDIDETLVLAGPWKKQQECASCSPRGRGPSIQHDESGAKSWKATLLFIVVICLEVTDIIFAVDSVSAIVAQIADLYLAYTACVFAMLGLRSMFFVIDELVRMFTLLKYGVALILVLIGMKLMVHKQVHISTGAVLFILLATVTTCIIASVLYNRIERAEATADDVAGAADVPYQGSPEDTTQALARA